MRLCLDTNAFGRIIHGDRRLGFVLEFSESVMVPAIVLGELHSGFYRGTRLAENRRHLASYLLRPNVSVAPVTAAIAERYGLLDFQLRRLGTPVPPNDLWIAATALTMDAHLVTYDGHFDRIADLSILHP